MTDSPGSLSSTTGNFLTRRQSTGDARFRVGGFYPASTPEHDCHSFQAPEGMYRLTNQVFFRSLAPLFSTGTTVSLVSIKYKEDHQTLQRYDPHPGARSFRPNGRAEESESLEDDDARTPSLSSSSSSFNNTHTNTISTSATAPHTLTSPTLNNNNHHTTPSTTIATTTTTTTISTSPTASSSSHQHLSIPEEPIPKLGSSLEGPSFLSSSPPNPPQQPLPSPTSTFSFLSRPSSVSKRTRQHRITRTHSSFVSRIVTNANLAKILVARTSDDTNLFFNVGSNFVWMDAFGHPKEPLSRVIFSKASPTCHDVNLLTRGSDHLDVVIGFTSGDIIWFDPLSNKYTRINKGGVMNGSAVTMIRWLQGSENLFLVAFEDGSMMVFDKDKEDEPFHPGDATSVGKHYMSHRQLVLDNKPVFQVTKPSARVSIKCNPVSHWKISDKSIAAFAFSPDCQHVAVVGYDGLLRVINFVQESLHDIYQAYYGGLTCVAWSPDGRYILTGGEDDLVTIWAFREQRIIARCQGHSSWVTGVAFDAWRSDDKVYRFASVGEDCKLVLWDFSVNTLHRPKARANTRHRGASVSSHNAPTHLLNAPTIHAVAPKTQVAFLQPTMVKTVHADPCVGVYFREEAIVTTDRRGRVSLWQRPQRAS